MNGTDTFLWYEAAMDAIETKLASIRHHLNQMPGVEPSIGDVARAQECLGHLCQAEFAINDYDE